MSVKTFTSGETLTASDTNTYLNNGGLVYIKSQTIGSGVANVTVTGAFSTTYDNYKIIVAGGAASVLQPMEMQLGSTVTGYYYSLVYATYATGLVAGATGNNAGSIKYVGTSVTNGLWCNIEVNNPFLTTATEVTSSYFDLTNAGQVTGFANNNTSYTSFLLGPSTGTLTGGTITVYGYRKA